jgi:hypothetical protein
LLLLSRPLPSHSQNQISLISSLHTSSSSPNESSGTIASAVRVARGDEGERGSLNISSTNWAKGGASSSWADDLLERTLRYFAESRVTFDTSCLNSIRLTTNFYLRLTSACLQEPVPSQSRPRLPPTLHSSSRASFPPSDPTSFPVYPHLSRAASAAPDLSIRSPSSSSSSSLQASAARRTFRRGALPLGTSPAPPIFSSSNNIHVYASSSPPSSIRPRQRSDAQVYRAVSFSSAFQNNCTVTMLPA